MKVLLVNGSPHAQGCTHRALTEAAAAIEGQGLETELFSIGTEPVRGCVACGACGKHPGRCAFADDRCNDLIAAAREADGIVIGSPVYFSAPNGALCALLDRAFYAGASVFAHKPAAAVVSCRRTGASAALDQLNKYFAIRQMPVVSSQYWNAVHGNAPHEVEQDLEGLQIMRTLGVNMARLVTALSAVPLPEPESRIATNFIR